MSARFQHKIVFTDRRCVINGDAKEGIPVILSADGIVEELSDYLRYLATGKKAPSSTLHTYAKTLKEFWDKLNFERRCWTGVSDAYLCAWRDHMVKKRGLKEATVNNKIRTVFGFYVWAEKTARISHVVDLSGEEISRLPISTIQTGKDSFATPLVFKTTDEPTRHTPSDEEVDELHRCLKGRHAIRDGLIMTWAEETALRRESILSITTRQIPTLSDIRTLYDQEKVHVIRLKVKGGRRPQIKVPPALLEATRHYIEFERAEILADVRSKTPNFRDRGELFLSETGRALKLNSVSKTIGQIFKRAKVPDANLHRLRAVKLTRLVEHYVGVVDEFDRPMSTEAIVFEVQKVATWKTASSLRHYVDAARSKRANRKKPEDEGR